VADRARQSREHLVGRRSEMTLRFARGLFLAAVALGVPAAAQTPAPKSEVELIAAGHKPMSGPEIGALLTGNTGYYLFLATVGGVKAGIVTPAYYRDARVRVLRDSSGKKVEGNWWLEGNLACAEQQYIAQGHVCFTYYRVDPTIYVCRQPDRACHIVVRMVPGNPEAM
jgi:hypothetical protein